MHGRAADLARKQMDWMDAWGLEGAQSLAQESFGWAQAYYRRSAAVSQAGIRLWAGVAETAWGSAKLLNDKVVRSVALNAEAAFDAAEACARADSLYAIVMLQGDFVWRLLAQTCEQTKEFVDLSGRASQHLLETIEDAAVRLMRVDF
jgi:phasin protein